MKNKFSDGLLQQGVHPKQKRFCLSQHLLRIASRFGIQDSGMTLRRESAQM